ncbi:MAG: efflux RND transporter periplasmic adaptor subunit [Cellvibrio sp.]|uniref:efflux RND transporter periplasmic adaptor subunit n=1 Tax=Cellvibrio sp. TaxID=1965322 RepID=UPI0031A5D67D
MSLLLSFPPIRARLAYVPLGLALFLTLGCSSDHGDEEADSAPEVAVITLAAQDFPVRTELPGRVSALRIAEVRPQVSGIVEKRLFAEGSDVKAGDLLYQINADTYKAAMARANADLAIAKANLVNLQTLAERHTRLLTSKSVSPQEHDQAQANYQQGLAQVGAAEAELEVARLNLERTKVRAPIAGRIGRSAITEGALVSADQPESLATIQQFDPIYVDIVQSSQQLLQHKRRLQAGDLKPGDRAASLILEDGAPFEQQGFLKLTELNVDPATGVVTLRAQFPNPQGLLLPGMYVRALIEQGIESGVVLIPQQAVHYNEKNEPAAWVIGTNNQAELRALELLGSEGSQWAVRKGLKAGERIVVEGSLRVRPGQGVKPVAWVAPAAHSVIAKADVADKAATPPTETRVD